MWTEIELNECEHFLKANWERFQINECDHFLNVNRDRSKLNRSVNSPYFDLYISTLPTHAAHYVYCTLVRVKYAAYTVL